MNQSDYVYCTNCKHFRVTIDYIDCMYEGKCDIYDPEDSKPLSQRPFYEEAMYEKPR